MTLVSWLSTLPMIDRAINDYDYALLIVINYKPWWTTIIDCHQWLLMTINLSLLVTIDHRWVVERLAVKVEWSFNVVKYYKASLSIIKNHYQQCRPIVQLLLIIINHHYLPQFKQWWPSLQSFSMIRIAIVNHCSPPWFNDHHKHCR